MSYRSSISKSAKKKKKFDEDIKAVKIEKHPKISEDTVKEGAEKAPRKAVSLLFLIFCNRAHE
jgi:hypothetical protein